MNFSILYAQSQAKKALTPCAMKFIILVDSSLIIITVHLVFLNHAQEQRRGFLRNNAFFLYDLYEHALAQELLRGSWNLQSKLSLHMFVFLFFLEQYINVHKFFKFI